MIIYGILLVLAIIGVILLNLSADYAIQISQYDFGSDAAIVSWRKDALLNIGSGVFVTVIIIFIYNEFQNYRARKDISKRSTIAAKKLCKKFKLFLQVAYFDLILETKRIGAHRKCIAEIKHIINKSFSGTWIKLIF